MPKAINLVNIHLTLADAERFYHVLDVFYLSTFYIILERFYIYGWKHLHSVSFHSLFVPRY